MLTKAIKFIKPGVTWDEVHKETVNEISRGLIELNLIKLLAVESNKQRVKKIKENVQRLGLKVEILNKKIDKMF